MISVNELNKSYGNIAVLKNLNLEFQRGKVYGIVGENGAGKSTLFRCLAGLESYNGQVISDLSPLKNHLGYLPTDPFLFNKMTGIEYIKMVVQARGQSINNIGLKNIFDLPLNQYATTYSTGMRKKLALTAILLQNNDYFILDEPFNGIDIQSNIILTEIIARLKELQKIVVLSSHIFSTLSSTCDEIYFLEKGQPTRNVPRSAFESLEQEMKDLTLAHKIENLGLI